MGTILTQIITIGNEKGGAGKSTISVHVAIAALKAGHNVAVLDLDIRQQSFAHFLENRQKWSEAKNLPLPQPDMFKLDESKIEDEEFIKNVIEEAVSTHDYLIIDTPGANSTASRIAHGLADKIITPMNDSFVDFDLLAKVDPVSGEVTGLNFYANQIWEARKNKAMQHKKHLEWFILRNRLSTVEARNKRKVGDALDSISKRLGFKIVPGLSERVIFRELYPMGLTLLDLEAKIPEITMSISHVAARQELRDMLSMIGI